MKPKIRKQDRKVSNQEAIKIIENGEFGVLSMCTSEEEGYGIPLNYILHKHALYFHCALEGFKLDNLRKHNKVSFCVVGKTKILSAKFSTIYESAIVFGSITEIEGDEKREALISIIEKYSQNYIPQGKAYIDKLYDKVIILKLNIDSITGKARRK